MGPEYTYKARLVRVIDGDTVVLCFDLGFRLSTTLPVRLLQVDTPERSEAGWRAATAFATEWFTAHEEVLCSTLKNPEKYGRWLGIIHPLDGGQSLNDALIAAGHSPRREGIH